MKVTIKPENKVIDTKAKKVSDLLEELGFKASEVIVIDIKNQRLLVPEDNLDQIDEIEIRKVISGG